MYNTVEIVEKTLPGVVYIFMERTLDMGTDEFGGLMPAFLRSQMVLVQAFLLMTKDILLLMHT